MTSRKNTIPHEARTDSIKIKAFKMMFRRWGQYMGYSSRREFWWAYLIALSIILFAIGFVITALLIRPEIAVILTLVISVFLIAFLVSYISLIMRRLADAGFNRYFGMLLLVTLIPYEMVEIEGRVFSYGEIIGGIIQIMLLILCAFPTQVKTVQ